MNIKAICKDNSQTWRYVLTINKSYNVEKLYKDCGDAIVDIINDENELKPYRASRFNLINEETGELIMLDKKLYAFWKCENFPFVQGAEVINIENDGKVNVITSEECLLVKTIIILPYEQGKSIQNNLDNLKIDYLSAIKKVEEKYHDKMTKIFPFEEKS